MAGFEQINRRHERRQSRRGLSRMLRKGRAALGTWALVLVLVSAQGTGFLVHALQLSAVDTDGCLLGPLDGGGKPGDTPDGAPTVLRNSAAADPKNPHDCSTCLICQQFLRSPKICWTFCPMVLTFLSIGRDYVIPFLDRYRSRETAPCNVRAPPLTELI